MAPKALGETSETDTGLSVGADSGPWNMARNTGERRDNNKR